MEPKLVKFEPELLKAITRAARLSHIKASQWVRNACREKLERDAQARRMTQNAPKDE